MLWVLTLGESSSSPCLRYVHCTYIGSISHRLTGSWIDVFIYGSFGMLSSTSSATDFLHIYRLRPRLSFPVFCWDVPVVSLHPASVILSHFFTSVFLMLLLIFFHVSYSHFDFFHFLWVSFRIGHLIFSLIFCALDLFIIVCKIFASKRIFAKQSFNLLFIEVEG